MRVVLTYDVVDDRRRARLHKRLKRLLVPVQKSVFEGWLPPARMVALEALLHRELDLGEDSVRVYALCRGCSGLVRSFGVGIEPRGPDEPVIL